MKEDFGHWLSTDKKVVTNVVFKGKIIEDDKGHSIIVLYFLDEDNGILEKGYLKGFQNWQGLVEEDLNVVFIVENKGLAVEEKVKEESTIGFFLNYFKNFINGEAEKEEDLD